MGRQRVRHPARQRAVATALIALALINATACTTWQPISQPVPEKPRPDPGQLFRVRSAQGERQEITKVEFRNDSMFGSTASARYGEMPIAVAMSDVRSVERQHVDAGRTAGLVLIGAAAVLVIAVKNAFNQGWHGVDLSYVNPRPRMR